MLLKLKKNLFLSFHFTWNNCFIHKERTILLHKTAFLYVFFVFVSKALAIDINSEITKTIDISDQVEISFDGKDSLFVKNNTPTINPPLFNTEFFVKFPLTNMTDKKQEFLIETKSFNTGTVTYSVKEGTDYVQKHLGGSSVKQEGEFFFFPLMPVSLDPGETKEFLIKRKHHFKFLGKVQLTSYLDVRDRKEKRLIIMSYFAIFLVSITLIALLSAYLLKDNALGHFSAFTLFMIPGLANVYGYFDYLGFTLFGLPLSHNTILISVTYMTFFNTFIRAYLDMKWKEKTALNFVSLFLLVVPLPVLFVRYSFLKEIVPIPMSQVVDLWFIALLLFMLFISVKRKEKEVLNYSAISMAFIIMGAFIYFLQHLSFTKDLVSYSEYGILVGVGAGILTFYIGALKKAFSFYKELVIPLLEKKDFVNLGQVSGFLMHEIKNHLYAQQMGEGTVDKDLKVELTELVHISEALVDANSTLEGISRLNFFKLLEYQLRQFDEKFKSFNITVENQLSVFFLESNETALNIIIKNILKNAIEYLRTIPESKRSLKIAAQQNTADIKIFFTNRIEDNFSFTSEELFRAFFSTKENLSNRGLGLYISKQLCEKLGVEIDIAIEKDEINFILIFPKSFEG